MTQSLELDHVDRLLDELERAATDSADVLAVGQLAVEQLAALTGADSVELFAALRRPQGDGRRSELHERSRGTTDAEIAAGMAPEWILLKRAGRGGPTDQQQWLSELIYPSQSGGGAGASGTRRVDSHVQFAVGICGDDRREPLAALVVTVAEPCPRSAETGILALLDGFADVLGHHFRAGHRRARAEGESQYDHFLAELYACKDDQQLADSLAHDLPPLLRAQRIAVARRSRRGWRLRAITGAGDLALKTELVTAMERFIAESGQPRPYLCVAPPSVALETRHHPGPNPSAAPDTLVVPLVASGLHCESAHGSAEVDWMVVQWDSSQGIGHGLPWMQRVFRHLVAAGGRVAEAPSGLGRLSKIGARAGLGRRIAWGGLAALVGAAVLAAATVETDFTIEAKGYVEPVEQRLIFAPHDGYVDELLVEEGQTVSAGELLARLRSPQLELQQRGLDGEIAAARKRRDGLTIAISQLDSGQADAVLTARQLAAEVESLEEKLAGLVDQRALIDGQIAQLELRCPIDGTVVTWDARRNLQSRPVQRGDALLKVANISGPWRMRLWVPDRDFSHIQRAATDGEEANGPAERQVTFKMMSRPNDEFQGTLTSIGNTVQIPENTGPAIAVDFAIDRDAIPGLRVGATTTGRVQCGRRAWWYVWTRTLQESIQRRFWIMGEGN